MYSRHLLLYNGSLFINVIQPLDDYGDDIIMHGIIQMLFVSSNSNLVHRSGFSFPLLSRRQINLVHFTQEFQLEPG